MIQFLKHRSSQSFRIFWIALFWIALSIPSAFSQNQGSNNHVRIQLIPSVNTAVAGQSFDLILEQNIDEHWHTYWKNPGDSGFPIQIQWNLPEGVEISDFQWPTPKVLDIQGVMNFVYEDTARLIAHVTLPQDLTGNTINLNLQANWLVCKEICIPETGTASIELPIGEQKELINQPAFEAAKRELPSYLEDSIDFKESGNQLEIELEKNPFETVKNSEPIHFFSYDWGIIKNGYPATIRQEDTKTILSFPRSDRALEEIPSLHGVLAQGKKGIQTAQKPETQGTLLQESHIKPIKSDTPVSSFLTALLFAILGGILLNLMPCVFPILSMKALSLVKIAEKNRADAIKHGLSYTGGIILSFIVLASAILALKSGGAEIGWGFQLQNPLVILGLSWLLFVIGLNFLGVFDITGRWAQMGSDKLVQSKGLTKDFLTGVLAVIVATPCTAPFMGIALGYALIQPSFITFIIFIGLGFGLALPFLLLSISPTLQKSLPKPGAWMETFKQFLAFPMWATVIWLCWVLVQQSGTQGLLAVLSGIWIISFILWLMKYKPSNTKGQGFKILLLILCVLGLFKATQLIKNPDSSIQKTYTSELLEKALESESPVFVNMTAAWCITCKVNEIVLESHEIQTLFKDQNVTYIIGDWTVMNPDITAYLESFDRTGVPLYVYYPPHYNKDVDRPEAEILPQMLTKSIIRNTIDSQAYR